MKDIIIAIREALASGADPEFRMKQQRFFREEVIFYGLRNAEVQKLSSEFFKTLPEKSKSSVFELCEKLWQSGYAEEAFIACDWSYRVKKQYSPDDFLTFGNWVDKYVTNWATCDTLCNHTVGTLVEMYPECIKGLKNWAVSNNRWMRRASSVTLIIPARKGLFLEDIFEIAEILLTDRDDMVQKGYGWMLKAASEAHTEDVFRFVTARKARMPRTAYRYAIEKMPPAMRAEAMKK